jgi:hypothetical protein
VIPRAGFPARCYMPPTPNHTEARNPRVTIDTSEATCQRAYVTLGESGSARPGLKIPRSWPR